MAKFEVDQGILKLQRIILILVMMVLALAVIIGMYDAKIGYYLGYTAVILLIIAAPIRIIAVSKYFKKRNDRRYELLSYIVILIIILTAIIRAII